MLDGALTDPAAHRTLFGRLRAAGLVPVYRRFDPRLGEADLDRYRVVVWLAGRVRGSTGSLAVEPVEAERAARLVRAGGRLVLGVAPGRRAAEGEAFQSILDRLGVPIGIGPHEVVDLDAGNSYPAALVRAPLFVPDRAVGAAWRLPARLAGGRSAPLEVGEGARPLLRTRPTAFLDRLYGPPPEDPADRRAFVVAADAGAGAGRVLVASRALLGAGGSLGQADLEPILPDALPAGAVEGRERLLARALGDLVAGLPGLAPAPPDPVPDGRALRAAVCAPRPGEAWLDTEGIKAAWGYVDRPAAETEALLARLPGTGLNALWGPARQWWGALVRGDAPAASRADAQAGVARVTEGLRGTSVRWLAGINVPGSDADLRPYPRAVSIGGRTIDVPAPLDRRYHEEVLIPRVAAVASQARQAPALAGIVLDLEMYGQPVLNYSDAFDFGDGPFHAFLESVPGAGDARALPAEERGDWLLARGRLPAYYAFLEARATGLGRRLREAVDAAAPGRDLVLGFYAVGVMPHWYHRGLWRGASAGKRPVVLLTFQTEVEAEVARAASEGTCLYHAQAGLLGLVGEQGLSPALARAARRHDGFWLNRVTHLVADHPVPLHDAVEVPHARGEAGWTWLREGVRAYDAARAAR